MVRRVAYLQQEIEDSEGFKDNADILYLNLGLCESRMGYLPEAMRSFSKAEELANGEDKNFLAALTQNTATAYFRMKDYPAAASKFEAVRTFQGVQEDPEILFSSLYHLAECFHQLRQSEKALATNDELILLSTGREFWKQRAQQQRKRVELTQ